MEIPTWRKAFQGGVESVSRVASDKCILLDFEHYWNTDVLHSVLFLKVSHTAHRAGANKKVTPCLLKTPCSFLLGIKPSHKDR